MEPGEGGFRQRRAQGVAVELLLGGPGGRGDCRPRGVGAPSVPVWVGVHCGRADGPDGRSRGRRRAIGAGARSEQGAVPGDSGSSVLSGTWMAPGPDLALVELDEPAADLGPDAAGGGRSGQHRCGAGGTLPCHRVSMVCERGRHPTAVRDTVDAYGHVSGALEVGEWAAVAACERSAAPAAAARLHRWSSRSGRECPAPPWSPLGACSGW